MLTKYQTMTEWKQRNEGEANVPKLLRGEADNPRKASHWVGADWSLPQDVPVVVTPKFNYLQAGSMLIEILEFDRSTFQLCKIYSGKEKSPDNYLLFVRPSARAITLPENGAEEFLPIQIIAFMTRLCDLLERRRKTDRIARRHNFDFRVKGRVVLHESMRKNWSRGLPHKTVCDVTEQSSDIPVNQVFYEALVRCSAYLARAETKGALEEIHNALEHKLRRARALLHGVGRIADTSARNLNQISSNLRGYYAGHRPVFDLARCIIRNDSFVVQPTAGAARLRAMTVPFGINMDLLFELFIRTVVGKLDGVHLELSENTPVWKESTTEGNQKIPRRRPDIIGRICKADIERKFIVEVKYYGQDWLKLVENDEKKVKKGYARPREGFFQVVAYKHIFSADIAVVVFPADNFPADNKCESIQGSLGAQDRQGNIPIPVGNLNFVRVGNNYKNKLITHLKSALVIKCPVLHQ